MTALDEALKAVTDAVYMENERGGEARGVVRQIGTTLGLALGIDPVGGEVWSPANMQRVVDAVRALKAEADQLRKGKQPVVNIHLSGVQLDPTTVRYYYGEESK